MSKSLAHLREQIEELQREASQLERDVVVRMRREIALHGITAEQLFGEPFPMAAGGRAAKYGDHLGNTWGGRGKRPRWLQEALANGRKLEDFLLVQPGPRRDGR
ncbi:H-NS family nucleoid-associated regulatory protein [Burkholderiaceae bacterium UC74_6]